MIMEMVSPMIMKGDTIDGGSRSNKRSGTHFSETVKHVGSKGDVETTSCYWPDLALSSHNSCIIIWPFLHFVAVCELYTVKLDFDRAPSHNFLWSMSAFSIVINMMGVFLPRPEPTVSECV